MSDSDDKSNNRWIAVNPKNLNKFVTLKMLCSRLNIDLNESIFFGDGPNDIEAIEGVGLGVAMGNAFDEVKSYAKDVAPTNDEDGIAKYLRLKI